MKSARINFGQPNTEYKLEINDAGEATSCYNQDTETEYIGGGGEVYEVFNVHVDPEASTETETYLDATWQEVYDAIIANKFVALVAPEQEDRDLIISITHEASESGGIAYASAGVTIPSTYPYISYVSGSSSQWLATLETGDVQEQLRADSANSKLYMSV